MKKRKINKEALTMLWVMVVSAGVVIHDMVTITIATFTGKMAGWTWLGFISFIFTGMLLDMATEYFNEKGTKKENQ